eukprot:jgi/Botrbrau1/23307/Bobra.0102s0046.1
MGQGKGDLGDKGDHLTSDYLTPDGTCISPPSRYGDAPDQSHILWTNMEHESLHYDSNFGESKHFIATPQDNLGLEHIFSGRPEHNPSATETLEPYAITDFGFANEGGFPADKGFQPGEEYLHDLDNLCVDFTPEELANIGTLGSPNAINILHDDLHMHPSNHYGCTPSSSTRNDPPFSGLRGALGSPRDASIDAHMRGGCSGYSLWTSEPSSMFGMSLQSPLEVPEGLFSSLPHEEEIVNPFNSHNHSREPNMYGPNPSSEGAGRRGNGPLLPLIPSPSMQRWVPRIGGRPDPSGVDPKELQELDSRHKAMLTPASKRKGKGGRQPAGDPRLIPGIDIRKARRIMANRLSAAKSKHKQKKQIEDLRGKNNLLKEEKAALDSEIPVLEKANFENAQLNARIQTRLETYQRAYKTVRETSDRLEQMLLCEGRSVPLPATNAPFMA